MGDDVDVRPGFNLECSFKGHLSVVRGVLRNPNSNCFVSYDDKVLKAWSVDKDGGTKILHSVSFQSTFINALVLGTDINMYLVACLDGNLRVYNERLQLKSCMPWQNGQVRDMIYNIKRQEIITAGSGGVKVWECEMDYEAYRNSKDLNPFDIPRTADGQVVTWCFGKFQHAKAKMTLNIPSSAAPGGASRAASCDKIVLHESSQVLFLIYEGSVFGYELATGMLTMRFANMHQSAITSMAYLPDQEAIVTSSTDSGGTVWRITGGTAHHYKQLGASSLILHMTTDDTSSRLLTCSADGSVTLWSTESLLPVYKMKLSGAAVRPTFYSRSRFFLHLESDVKIFSIQNLYESWMDCNSEPLSLRQLSFGLILAEFADSSVRILDGASQAADKSAATTVPQLSTYNLRSACCSLPTGRLFTLLSNSHIHTWEVHLKGPPTFMEAWTHLAKEDCRSMAVLDGVVTNAAIASSLGLLSEGGVTYDHLLLGTSTGDCIVCSVNHGGIPVFRFPAFKHQPLEHMSLDLDRGMLVTCSKAEVKVWSLVQDIKCIHNLDAGSQVTKVEILEGRAIIGTALGSVLLLDMPTGRSVLSSSSSDHMDRITGIGASVHLQHCVTGSRDRAVKVFDRDKVLKRSIYIATPISCCCYLNDDGDILLGLQSRLVVVLANTYQWVGKIDVEDGKSRTSIYNGLRGSGTRPLDMRRADACQLQKLSTAEMPVDMMRPSSPSRSLNSVRALSPAAKLRLKAQVTPSPLQRSNTLAKAIALHKAGLPSVAEAADVASRSNPGKPHAGLVPPPKSVSHLPAKALCVSGLSRPVKLSTSARPAAAVEPTAGPSPKPGPSGQLASNSQRTPRVKSATPSKEAHPSQLLPSPSRSRTTPPVLAPLDSYPVVPVESEEEEGRVKMLREPDFSESGTLQLPPLPAGHDGALPVPAGEKLAPQANTAGETTDGDGTATDGTATGADDGTCESGDSDDSDEEVEETADKVAEAAPLSKWQQQEKELQERRIRELMETFRHTTMPDTRFSMALPSLAEEQARKQRKLHGLMTTQQVIAPLRIAAGGAQGDAAKGVAMNVRADAAGGMMMNVGDLSIMLTSEDINKSKRHTEAGGAGASEQNPDAPDEAAVQHTGAGLAAAFRRALPIVCSSSAFLDVEAFGPELKFKRTKLRRIPGLGKKKKKKALEDLAEEEPGAVKKKKKKKKRRRRKAEIDPAKSLAQGTTQDSILTELQLYQRHRMITQQVAVSFLPGLSARSRPVAGAGGSKEEQIQANLERAKMFEPPDQAKMLKGLRHGWKPGFLDPHDLGSVDAILGSGKGRDFLSALASNVSRLPSASFQELDRGGRLIAKVPHNLVSQGADLVASGEALHVSSRPNTGGEPLDGLAPLPIVQQAGGRPSAPLRSGSPKARRRGGSPVSLRFLDVASPNSKRRPEIQRKMSMVMGRMEPGLQAMRDEFGANLKDEAKGAPGHTTTIYKVSAQ